MSSVTNTKLYTLACKFTELIKDRFKNDIISIVLFGSVARGEAKKHSDIDLLLIFNKLPVGHLLRTRLLDEVEDELEKRLDELRKDGIYSNFNYLLKTKEEAAFLRPLYFDLTEDAIYLFDKNDFFKKIVDNLRQRLKRIGSKRKKVGLIRYWDLKPDLRPGEVFEI